MDSDNNIFENGEPTENGEEPEISEASAEQETAQEVSAVPLPADASAEKAPQKPPRPKKTAAARLRSLLGCVALMLFGALIALMIVPNSLSLHLKNDSVYAKLSALESVVRSYYVDAEELDDRTLSDMMAAGYIFGLGDQYSAYLGEETYSSILYSNQGGSSGVGVTVVYDPDAGAMRVIRVSQDSPAGKADLRRHDWITAVDGVAVTQENYSESVENIRGDNGTDVTLTVRRENTTFDVTVTRSDYTSESVFSRMIGTVCYIEITDFNAATVEQFRTALDDAIAAGATGLIFDLRDNTGGLVDATSQMLDMLLPEGEIAYAVYNGGKRVSLAKSDADEIDLPMVVLTNGATASASEYFTSALRDFGKAVVIGEKTFGKGIMQSTIPLGDGTAVRLTVAKFYTPSGAEFHGIGLTPDKEVLLDDSVLSRFLLADEDEPVLQAALEELNRAS